MWRIASASAVSPRAGAGLLNLFPGGRGERGHLPPRLRRLGEVEDDFAARPAPKPMLGRSYGRSTECGKAPPEVAGDRGAGRMGAMTILCVAASGTPRRAAVLAPKVSHD